MYLWYIDFLMREIIFIDMNNYMYFYIIIFYIFIEKKLSDM